MRHRILWSDHVECGGRADLTGLMHPLSRRLDGRLADRQIRIMPDIFDASSIWKDGCSSPDRQDGCWFQATRIAHPSVMRRHATARKTETT
jgi:hypothetical protein